MKHLRIVLLPAFIFAAAAWAQDPKISPAASASPPPALTIPTAVDREISRIEKQIVDAAEAMPADKFNFSPESLKIPGSDYKGVRTFGEQIKHVAATNYLLWSPVTGDKVPDNVNEGKGPDNMKTKAEIISYLKDSYALGHKAAASLTAANLVEPLTMGKNQTTRLFLATFGAAHGFDHYGQMVEYLRMNGIVPPASRKSE